MTNAYTPKELLFHRLRQINAIDFQGTGDSDDARTAIISCACAEAVAGRLVAGGKLWKFRGLFEEAFGQAFETRERVARAKRKAG